MQVVSTTKGAGILIIDMTSPEVCGGGDTPNRSPRPLLGIQQETD